MLSKDAIVICHMPLSLLQNPITYHQYHALLTIMSVRVTDRVQWAAEQFLPSGINVIKRGNVQGLLRFSVVQREREREHPQEWGRRQEQNHQAQLSEQTLGFQRLKSQSTYKTEFLSIPSSPSPCFLSISLYSTEEGNGDDNVSIWGDTARALVLNGLTAC